MAYSNFFAAQREEIIPSKNSSLFFIQRKTPKAQSWGFSLIGYLLEAYCLIALLNGKFRCMQIKDFKALKNRNDILNAEYLLGKNEEFNLDNGLIDLFESQAKGIYQAINACKSD